MKLLVILRGAPGSGKSTFIKDNGLEDLTLSTDKIRLMFSSIYMDKDGNSYITQRFNKRVFELLYKLLEIRMQNGDTTIIDATNTKQSSVTKFLELAKIYQYRTVCIDFSSIFYEKLLKQNREREPYKIVSEEVIKGMCENLKKSKQWFIGTFGENYIDYYKVNGKYGNTIWFDLGVDNSNHIIAKNIVVFSDIHGRIDKVGEYFKKYPYNEHTDYFFVGDYLDRGCYNKETLEWLIHSCNRSNFHFCEGNHERHLRDYVYFGLDSVRSKEFKDNTYSQIKDISKDKIKLFLSKLKTNFIVSVEYQDFCINHAGIPCATLDLFCSAINYIKGVGEYEDIDYVANKYVDTCKYDIQVCGHRKASKIKFGETFYALNSEVEGNEPLNVLFSNGKETRVEQFNGPKEDTKDEKQIIEQLNTSDLVKKKYLDNGIVSYNFTREAFYRQKWNELTCKARGLFVDSETGKIVARSYDKFFNEDQLTKEQLQEFEPRFEVSYKENGYLGLLSYNPKTDDFFIATKSVDYGDYKDWFKQILEDKNYLTDELKQYLKENNVTFVFEVIDPEHDSHIIEYDEKQVCLLDIIRNEFEFKPYPLNSLSKVAERFSMERKDILYTGNGDDIENVVGELRCCDYSLEGFVLRDRNNKMLKVKLPYYKFCKRVRSYLEKIINNKLNYEDIYILKEDNEMKRILFYAFNNYYSDMSLIDFRKEYLKYKGEK
jgi:predicted kinase